MAQRGVSGSKCGIVNAATSLQSLYHWISAGMLDCPHLDDSQLCERLLEAVMDVDRILVFMASLITWLASAMEFCRFDGFCLPLHTASHPLTYQNPAGNRTCLLKASTPRPNRPDNTRTGNRTYLLGPGQTASDYTTYCATTGNRTSLLSQR